MTPEIRNHLRAEVSRLQHIRWACDAKLLQAWGLACVGCGGHADDITPECDRCSERHRSRERRATKVVLAPGDPRHGTNGYVNFRCRCGICTASRRQRSLAVAA